ncbi:MAG: hypothetical protein LBD03_02850 [Methanobrevibacter sp.]|nr:hypothetical protein [Candidatus Methanovirga procula]
MNSTEISLVELCFYSWLIPGSGHMYYRQVRKARSLLIFTFLWYTSILPDFLKIHSLNIVSTIILLVYIILATYSVYDVYRIWKQHSNH